MTRRGLVMFAAVACVFVAHALVYRGFFIDDAFISLRYAQRLLGGHGLTWTDGERVEGYSNLLWVLGCAALGATVMSARILGFAAALAALAAPIRAYPRLLPAAFAAGVLACAMPLAGWAMGGLEAPLVAALLAWGVTLLLPLIDRDQIDWREAARPGIVFALLAWTRPDGALLPAALLVGLVLARRGSRAAFVVAAKIGSFVAAAVMLQLAFRLGYYGEWVPNTALIKVKLSAARLRQGRRYLFFGALNGAALLIGAAVAVFFGARRRVVVLGTALVIWLGYVWVIGGDWMPAHRQLVAALVLLAFLGAEALAGLVARGGDWVVRGWILGGVLLGLFALTQANDSEAPGWKHRWVWDAEIVGDTLKRAFPVEKPLVAVDSAGALSYYSALPALDLMGLTDRHIARHPAPEFGRGVLGHEHGDGKYALDRAPDLAIFCGPQGGRACYLSGQQMEADPRFRDWVPVTLETGATRSLIWVRREGRVGVRRAPGRIVVPAWLLGRARPDSDGRLRLDVPAGETARLALPLPPGDWTVSTPGARLENGVVQVTGPAHLREIVLSAAGASPSLPR